MKKLFTFPLMALSVLSASALDFTVGGVSYTTTSDTTPYTASVVAGTYSGTVVVPESVSYRGTTYAVTAVAESAFSGSAVVDVTLPESIESIGASAFRYCSALKSVNIPSKVTVIYNYTFCGCSSLEEFTIPANITKVLQNVFDSCGSLKKLIIEDSKVALSWDSNSEYQYPNLWRYSSILLSCPLEEVYLGRDLTYTLHYSSSGEPVSAPFYQQTALRSLTIGKNVKQIGEAMFYECGIETLNIPNGVTTISQKAFYKNQNLKTLWLGNEVLSVGGSAFAECPKLVKRFLLPNTVPDHINDAFDLVEGAQVIVANESYGHEGQSCCGGTICIYPLASSHFTVDGVTYVPTSFSARSCDVFDCTYDPEVTSINIGRTVVYEGVTMNVDLVNDWAIGYNDYITEANVANNGAIDPYAFYGCPNLRSVTTANGDEVRTRAFSNSFTNVTDGNAILGHESVLGEYAFASCTGLKTLEIGTTVTTISDYAFQSAFSTCDEGSSAKINNTGDILQSAFNSCSNLQRVEVGPTVGNIGNDCFASSFTEHPNGEVTLNNHGTLGSSCFAYTSKLVKASLCEDITDIGGSCFYSATSLATVNIPQRITTIHASTFQNCSALQHILLPEGLQTIENIAFMASGLVDLSIPAATINIDNYVFNKCTALNDLRFEDSEMTIKLGYNDHYDGRSGSGKGLFYDCPLENVYIGRNLDYPMNYEYLDYGYSPFAYSQIKNVTYGETYPSELRANTFRGCGSLRTAHLGANQQTMGEYAFYNCYSLHTVNVPEGNLNIEQHTFDGCAALQRITLPESLQYIRTYAFANSGLVELAIPAATLEIEDDVFSGTTNLALFVMNDGDYTLKLGYNTDSNGLFHDCHLNKVVQGRNITYPSEPSQGYSPFYRNTWLTTVEVTDVPLKILENQFYGCTSLTDVTIGDGLTDIENYAFSGCTKLANFLFGESVATIGEEAFSDCTAMVHLYAEAVNPPVCGAQALDDINKWRCTLHVPAGTMDAYADAPQWKEFLKLAATEVVTGDANADGRISVADVSTIVDYVLGNEPRNIDMTAADANGDGSVLISDATTVVDMILTPATASTAAMKEQRMTNAVDAAYVTGTAAGHSMLVAMADADSRIISAQFDITMPEGVTLRSATASGTHTVAAREIAPGVQRVVVVSLDNSPIASGRLAEVEFDGDMSLRPEVTVSNIYVVDTELNETGSASFNLRLEANPASVDAIEGAAAFSARGGVMEIEVVAAEATDVTIVSMNGMSRSIRVDEGHSTIAVSAPGIYVVNNIKVVVR